MRVLVAFDKFKGALSAREAGAVAEAALAEVQPAWTCDLCPLTDGGEGFVEVLTGAAGGTFAPLRVTGPRGQPVTAALGQVAWEAIPEAAHRVLGATAAGSVQAPGGGFVAILELAAASGLALLGDAARNPWEATTFGTGEMLLQAHRGGARAIVLGLGGSATHDLGGGALHALGLEFQRADGSALPGAAPAAWPALARFGGALPENFPPVFLACDVTNPLLGPHGAAATYGPQKGLAAADLAVLDAASARVAALLAAHFRKSPGLADQPGAGAAGGIAFGLDVALGARRVPGFPLVAAWTGYARRLQAADVVITGEGRFDPTSGAGKAAGAVVRTARAAGKPVHVFAGQVAVPGPPAGVHLHPVSPAGLPLPDALRATAANLRAGILATFGAA